VGYLYDCQHKHHPEFFSAAQRGVRDRAFALMLSRASVVFANAKAVVSDLQGFFPGGRAKLFSLPFAPLVGDEELARVAEDARQARQRTHGADYFIVCNQFWIHKDHATAFRAFARFVHGPASGNHRLVCTGLTEDCRVPGHFDRLKALVKELGIAERVDFTGYIDRAEQLALVHGSTALLQPTLFEGGPGGGAASDAIALGVPCILSDIPVNREVIHPFASFFRVGDPNSLADAMQRTVATPPQRPAIEILAAANRRHTYALGESLYGIAQAARAA
jgi:glycosyltransferase involved in cell wall biosynthesis